MGVQRSASWLTFKVNQCHRHFVPTQSPHTRQTKKTVPLNVTFKQKQTGLLHVIYSV